MKTTVLGAGSWGTALALVLLENGHEVDLWSHRPESIEKMKHSRKNEMLADVTIPEEMGLVSTMEQTRDSDVVVMAVPSFAIRETARQLKEFITPKTVIVTVSKGIEPSTFLRLSQVIESEIPDCPVVVLSGPSHAEEVANGIPTGLVAAADSSKESKMVQDLFMNPNFRVYTSDDKIGTELCGALKNVMALCAGCCDGIGYGDNTKAMLVTRGVAEMTRLGVALGAKRETFNGLAGIGDLIVTCTSMHSRNRRFGIMVGEGKTIEEAKELVGGVAEGVYATETALRLAQSVGVEMPIVQGAYLVLKGENTPTTVLSQLMIRAKRSEEDYIPI